MLNDVSFFPVGDALAISPDGNSIAFVDREGDVFQLYLRRLDDLTATVIPGTGGARSPSFSADGEWLAFVRNGNIEKLRVSGGTPQVLVAASDATPGDGLGWGSDDMIYFSDKGAIQRVPASGGLVEVLTNREGAEHGWVSPSQDGRALFFTVKTAEPHLGVLDLETHSWNSTTDEEVLAPQLVPPGYLVFGQRDGTLLAAPFDLERKTISSSPQQIASGVEIVNEMPQFAVSASGVLVYVADKGDSLMVEDVAGTVRPLTFDNLRDFRRPRFSPDGSRITVEIRGDIWIYDIPRGTGDPIAGNGDTMAPLWSPDGNSLVYGQRERGLIQVPLGGDGQPELLTTETGEFSYPHAWTDGGRVVTYTNPVDGTGPRQLDLTTGTDRQLLGGASTVGDLDFSPNGSLVAYSLQSEGLNEAAGAADAARGLTEG